MNSKLLSDDEALKKANAVNWFDNKANCVSWIKPNKSRKKFKREDLNELSVEQLQEKYALAIDQLKAFGDVPEDAKQFVGAHASKLFSFMLAIRATIKSKATPEQNLFMEQFEDYRKKALSKENSSSGALKMQVNNLTQQLESLKSARSKDKSLVKLRNMELADNRERMIHIEFKKLVKERIGEIAYLSLIQEADVIADTKIALKEPKADAEG